VISFVDDTGYERFLGNVSAVDVIKGTYAVYGDRDDEELIDESKWGDIIAAMGTGQDWPHLPYVHDQDGIGQCNADATTAAAEAARSIQGLPFVKLSAADLYDQINGGADNGSMLEDGIDAMMKNGVGTAATCGTLWSRGMNRATSAERTRFKVLEAALCPTPKHVMSASIKGRPLISGILWYDNFRVDGDGWLPSRGSGQAGGHAVFGYKPTMRQTNSGTQFGIWHQNSWGNWGMRGRCVFPMSLYGNSIGGWWAIRAMTDEGGVVPPLVR
jgi:hypothetical protein